MSNVMKNEPMPWNPFAVARELMRWDPFSAPAAARMRTASFVPAFDVTELGDAYEITADLPGVRREDLDLSITGNQLRISGERHSARSPDDGDNVHVYERQYGAFVRTFTLPAQADMDNIEADLDDGVLRLNIPKKEEAKPRKLSLTERIKKKIKA